MNSPGGPVRLRVVTREVDAVEDVLAYTSSYAPTFWARRGNALAGFGSTVDLVAGGADAAASFSAQWRQLVAHAEIDDPVRLPGTGLIALGALTFDPASQRANALSVPWVVVGRRGGRCWVTRITLADATVQDAPGVLPPRTPYGPHWSATLGPGAMTPAAYQDAVQAALDAISRRDIEKVVLARDLVGSAPAGADLRRLVRSLLTAYPDCWIFAVDGVIGASPETLVSVSGGAVTARVLAGTRARGADADADQAAAIALSTSEKNQEEHRFAVRSLLDALRPHTRSLAADEQPFTLRLPNVWHLATDVEGVLSGGVSALDLVGALHPTAAVAGTPTNRAMELIRRLEPFDRGRYAGAVGWVDAAGDGEWAVTLRCAQFDAPTPAERARGAEALAVTAYAGAGVVAGSDPESELLETRVKFRPIVEALA